MNAFIEGNRRLLRISATMARTIGWVLLSVGPVLVVVALVSGSPQNRPYPLMYYSDFLRWRQLIEYFLLPGVILLGLAQCVRYICENNYRPGRILRNGDAVLYLYAAALVIGPVVSFFIQATQNKNSSTLDLLCLFLTGIVPSLAQAVISVGVGQILRRMLPMIEESKTLV